MNLGNTVFKYLTLSALVIVFGVSMAKAQAVKVKVDKPDSLNLQNITNSLKKKSAVHDLNKSGITDSIDQLTEGIKRIYSEKMLRESYDSLLQNNLIKIPAIDDKVRVSQEEYVNALNEKFHKPTLPSDPLQDDLPQLEEGKFRQMLPSGDLKSFSKLQLPSEEMINLPPIPHHVSDNKWTKKLDSLRAINLKDQKLKFEETNIDKDIKSINISEIPGFKERSYFEGILGIQNRIEDKLTFRFSPAFGYRFTPHLSFGMGPMLQLEEGNTKSLTWGLRSFGKYEVLKSKAYLQAENIFNSRNNNTEVISNNDQFNFLVGGGILLPFSNSLALNVSLLYALNGTSDSSIAPMVIRIGVSSFNKTKSTEK